MISLAWHHGLRASELADLGWSAIDWNAANRLKNGKDTRQPLDGGMPATEHTTRYTDEADVARRPRAPRRVRAAKIKRCYFFFFCGAASRSRGLGGAATQSCGGVKLFCRSNSACADLSPAAAAFSYHSRACLWSSSTPLPF
jgi:hypothetical protein